MSSDSLFITLQHADSFFPSGATSFSWGLETLCNEKTIQSSFDLNTYIEGQLRGRWITCELPGLIAAYRARGDLEAVARVDKELHVLSLTKEFRTGAERAGSGLLTTHAKLGTPHAEEYKKLVKSLKAPGQLSAVQGLLWFGVGLTEHQAAVLSGYSFCSAFVSAAIRLGLIGYVDSQIIIKNMHEISSHLLSQPLVQLEELHSYIPETDIAVMRHETADSRLFFN
ncbi:urease accessory UreF family protein [Methylophilus sp. VKM B-3414]|uniref:urease accessory protein UreF n=1 Tax=Methylophilus sp. VKM B-3414 TaxID=3076121 RepID=UPI0028CAEB6C|nr:urease accessory UreF family protein [Methylophilus sp. VKM B-3414]MDT7849721.1 urease accessory UreF family protein [Methylophilus sp. VKM B-3414]